MATKNEAMGEVSIKGNVKIRLPRAARGEEEYVFGSVNGKTFRIKRGEEVEVSEAVAEVLRHSEEMQEEADRYIDSAAH